MTIVKLLRAAWFKIIKVLVNNIPYFEFIKYPQNPTQHIDFNTWFKQKVIGYNYAAYWPMHFTSKVAYSQNILVGKGSFPGYMPGCYIQGIGHIRIGNYSIFSANVGIISANHDVYDNSKHIESKICIGSYCWVGMNAVILPGVILGDFTVVGAGAIVTKSFPEGYCVIGGNPARLLRVLDKGKCVRYEMNESFHCGYIRQKDFQIFAKKNLSVLYEDIQHNESNSIVVEL